MLLCAFEQLLIANASSVAKFRNKEDRACTFETNTTQIGSQQMTDHFLFISLLTRVSAEKKKYTYYFIYLLTVKRVIYEVKLQNSFFTFYI